jgi:ubiquitin carboxyl-terminal hydrolase 36/42
MGDQTHPKEAKQKVVLGGTTWRGGSLNRHQAGQPHRDHTADDLTHAFDEYRDAPYSPSDSPSPSESSSLFSNSDAGSHSTVSTDSSESTRNSTSTEEYEYVFGAADQMYPGGPMGGAPAESDYPTYSRSRSSLNTSSSGREAYSAYSSAEHKLQGGSGGLWVEGDDSPSLLYTDRSNQQLSSKLTDQYRQLDRSRHDPGETRGGVLLRRPSRDRTAQMMSRVLDCREIM